MGAYAYVKDIFSKMFLDHSSESYPHWADAEIVDINAEIDRVRDRLQVVRNNFNFATDPDMIEYYIYLQKAYEIRHDMLVRKLKARHEVVATGP